MKIKGLLEDKRFVMGFLIFNIVVTAILVIYLSVMITNRAGERNSAAATQSPELDMNSVMSDFYYNMLSGWTFKVGNVSFSFGKNHDYSGFFDKDNLNVVDYTYDISFDEKKDTYVLNIVKPDNSGRVSYELDTDEKGDILFRIPGGEDAFTLSLKNAEVIIE